MRSWIGWIHITMKSWRRSRPCSRREAKRWPGSRNPVKRLIDLEGKKSRSRSTGTGKSTGKCDDLSDTQTKPLITEVRYVHVSQIVYQQIEQFHQSIQCPVNAPRGASRATKRTSFDALAVVRTYVFSSLRRFADFRFRFRSIHIPLLVAQTTSRSTATKQAKMFSVATATLRRTVTKSPNAYTFVCRSMSSLPETMKVSQIRPRSV